MVTRTGRARAANIGFAVLARHAFDTIVHGPRLEEGIRDKAGRAICTTQGSTSGIRPGGTWNAFARALPRAVKAGGAGEALRRPTGRKGSIWARRASGYIRRAERS